MRKVVAVLMVLTMALALVPGGAIAGAEDDPDVYELYAGQDIDVGEVQVWNDADTLYVKFVTDGGWCVSETHVHVALDASEIPQRNGNPVPGQFDYSAEYDPCTVNPEPYQIPFEGELGKELYIAAHAVVVQLTSEDGDQYADAVVSFNRVDGIEYDTSGDNGDDGSDLLGAPRGIDGCVIQVGDPSSCWTSPGYIPGSWNGTTFVPDFWNDLDDAYCLQDDPLDPNRCPQAGDITVDFTDNLCQFADDPSQASLFVWEVGGKTEGFLAEALDEDGNVLASYTSPAQAEFNEAIPIYFDGADMFSRVRLTPTDNGGGDPIASNTSGPDFDAVECLAPIYAEETAWGDGEDFPGRNWATYITYEVQCPYEPELVNGGFETPTPQTTQGWDIYDSGTDGLGWTVEWADEYDDAPDPAHLEIHTNGTIGGVDAHEGTQYAELDTDWDGPGGGLNGEPASVKIYQVLDTCPGQTYTLTYAWRGRPGYESAMDVSFGSYSASHSDNSGEWNVVEETVTADGWTEKLEFVETGTPDSFGMFLDAVSVEKCDNCGS